MAGAGVEQHVDATLGESSAGTIGDPGIFADFESKANTVTVEEQVSEGPGVGAGVVAVHVTGWPGAEPARFVVQTIACKVLFGGEAGDGPIGNEAGGVEDTVAVEERQSHGDGEIAGGGDDLQQLLPCGLPDVRCEKHVFAAIAGDAEFGEAEHLNVLFAGLVQNLQDAVQVSIPVERGLVQVGGCQPKGAHGQCPQEDAQD